MSKIHATNPPEGGKSDLFIETYRAELPGWRVLEVGPADGRWTREIAAVAREVVAIEPRPQNVAATRMATAEFGNVTVVQDDAEDGAELKARGPYDAVFHCGVFYHLRNPVRHLHDLAAVTPRLWLQTGYADRAINDLFIDRKDITFNGRKYTAYRKAEANGNRSGLHGWSRWLPGAALMQAVIDAGFSPRIMEEWTTKNGMRVVIDCRRGDV